MCLVIDTCTITSVFNPRDESHEEFQPILQWLTSGLGKMVFGGSKYKQELKRLSRYLKIITELQKAGKCILIDDKKVDNIQKDIESKYNHRDFDDVHIVAIVIASKVRLICTKERRAIPWYKNNKLYPPGVKKPKLYTSKRNRTLLNKKYIINLCR